MLKKMILCTFTLAVVVICGGYFLTNNQEKTVLDVSDDGKIIYATFDKTWKGTGVGSGITIEPGEHLIIDSKLVNGKVQVNMISESSPMSTEETMFKHSENTINCEFTESGRTEYNLISPGNYIIYVQVTDKASGNIIFTIVKDNVFAVL